MGHEATDQLCCLAEVLCVLSLNRAGPEIGLACFETSKLGLDSTGPVLGDCHFAFSLTLAPFSQLHSRAHPASDFPNFVVLYSELSTLPE